MNGFKRINNYSINNFRNLSKTLKNSVKSEDVYCNRWIEHYSKIFKNDDMFKIIDYNARLWRAIKELYASAILYKEAELAINNRCIISFFTLLYYSLFHGMLSAICFDINVTANEIVEITHSKVGKLFRGTFCNGKNAIMPNTIYDFFIELKNLREYYCYTPPLNLMMDEKDYLKICDEYLEGCFQLTNLHSLLLEKSGRGYDFTDIEEINYYTNIFNKLVAKINVENGEMELDPADENVMRETLRDGLFFQCIGLQLDHTYDEFRTYCLGYFNDGAIATSSIYSYIYQKII